MADVASPASVMVATSIVVSGERIRLRQGIDAPERGFRKSFLSVNWFTNEKPVIRKNHPTTRVGHMPWHRTYGANQPEGELVMKGETILDILNTWFAGYCGQIPPLPLTAFAAFASLCIAAMPPGL